MVRNNTGVCAGDCQKKMNRLTAGSLLFTGSIILARLLASSRRNKRLSSPLSTVVSSSSPTVVRSPQKIKKILPPVAKKCLEQIYFGIHPMKPDEYRGDNPMNPPIVSASSQHSVPRVHP
jgi:hypothetical protein